MNATLPCKDCICLAICRASYLQSDLDVESEMDPIVSIAHKCKLLHTYIFDYPKTSFIMIRNENTFIDFMKDVLK